MNFKIVLLIIVSMSALMLGGCEGKAERITKYLEKGKDYFKQENYGKARIELKNVIQIDPKHAAAFSLLGEVEEKEQNWQKAYGFYNKAVELDPEDLKARERLGRLHLFSGDVEKAVEQMEAILARDSGNLRGRRLKAAVMDRKGDLDGAIKEVNDVLLVDPSHWETTAFLATLYSKKREEEKAISILKKAISSTADNIPLRTELVRIHAFRKELDKVVPLLQQIIEIEPGELGHYLTLALFYATNNMFDEAEVILRETTRIFPEDVRSYQMLAEFLFDTKKVDQTIKELLASIKILPEEYSLYLSLAEIYRRMAKPDKSVQMYRKIIELDDTNPSGLQARNRLAIILLLQGNKDEAVKLTEEVLRINPKDSTALLFKGKFAMRQDDMITAINTFRSITKNQPDSVQVANLLAEAHLRNNEPELAKNSMQRMVEAKLGDAEARLSFAKYLVRIKDYDGALKVTNDMLAVKSNDFIALKLKVAILATKQDYDGAINILKTIKAEHPNEAFGYLQMGALFLNQKKYDDALREFEQALDKGASKHGPLKGIIRVYLSQGNKDKAITRLNNMLAESPDATVYQLLAEILFSEKKYKEAETNLIQSKKLEPEWILPYKVLARLYQQTDVPEKAAEVYREVIKLKGTSAEGLVVRNDLAKLLFGIGQQNEAVRLIDEILAQDPRDKNALLTKAGFSLTQLDAQTAIKILRRVLRFHPDFVVAARLLATAYLFGKETASAKQVYMQLLKDNPENMAALLSASSFFAKHNYDSEALQQADKLLEISPGNIEALGLKAELLMKRQDLDGVKLVLEEIVKTYPDSPRGYLMLGVFYQSQNKVDKALKEFETSLLKTPNAAEPLAAIVKIYLEQDQHDKAIIRLKRVIKTYSNHSVAHNLLGEVYVAQKKTDEAIKAFRKAIDLNTGWTVPYGNLANLYRFRGEAKNAIDWFQKGLKVAPNDALLSFSLAAAYEDTQEYDKAVAMYQEVLDNHSGNSRVVDAAINNMAMVLAGNKGDAQSLKKALELAKVFEGSQNPAFIDTLGWVYLKTGDVDKAISLLSKAVNESPIVPIFQYHLGLAYYNKGDFSKAKNHIAKALEAKTEFPGKRQAEIIFGKIK